MNKWLVFTLSSDFLDQYKDTEVQWGLKDAGDASLSEIVFLSKYSRKKEDGTKESWQDVCQRVVEGTFSIQKDWAKTHLLPWNDHKAARSAQEMYRRMFEFKWTPPGRGLQNMGTHMVNGLGYSTSLQNCGAVSTGGMTRLDPGEPFAFLMSASMMGVGIGYDTKGADKGFKIYEPTGTPWTYVVPDTREGWAEATRLLINSHLIAGKDYVRFDYSLIRAKGELIKTFGTKAPGPEPLKQLHRYLRELVFAGRVGQSLSTENICDIANLIGKCVVSGNTRRSALLAYGDLSDKDFISLKDWEKFPLRNGSVKGTESWAHVSNNSVRATVSDDLSSLSEGIGLNGEPGVIWEDTIKTRGRLIDPPDDKDKDFICMNPCAEQPLNDRELCTLVDVYVDRHDTKEDFLITLKYAYLYAKTVTLLPTHFPRTNAVMQKNRRIGTSLSGITNFIDNRVNGLRELRDWMMAGYHTINHYDEVYSGWLCVRESNRKTTIKPGGSTSLVVGTSAGGHWTDGGSEFERAMRMGTDDPIVAACRLAGRRVEPDVTDPQHTAVVFFPIRSMAKRSAREVSLYEKAMLAVELQRVWADNGVSITLSFDSATEKDHIGTILNMYSGQLKAVSFLPTGDQVYTQQPYTSITAEQYDQARMTMFPIDLSGVYAGNAVEITDEAYCSTDACEIKEFQDTQENKDLVSH